MTDFPFSSLRAGQGELIRDIEGIAVHGGVLLCSAPTGIGKTVAALWPMLKEALRSERQLFFVTAKTSQQELAISTLERMLEPGPWPSAVQIATRRRFCPLDGRVCGEPVCRPRRATDRGAAEQLAGLPAIASRSVTRADTTRDLALQHGLCPFELSLLWAERAYAIVGDANYVFDPVTYLRRFFDVSWSRQLLIVDEAHNLPERVAGFDSPVVDLVRLRALSERCRALGEDPFRGAARLFDEIEQRARARIGGLCQERAAPPPHVARLAPSLLEGLDSDLQELQDAYQSFVSERLTTYPLVAGLTPSARPGESPPDALLAQLADLRHLARVSHERPERFAGIFEAERLRALCLEPGDRIRERVQGFHASVCMSATLTPFAFHQRRLGLDGADVLTVVVPSPFPRRHRQILCVPSIDTRLAGRERDAPQIAARIAEVAGLRPGNYLAFFPSYAYRDQVVATWSRQVRTALGVRLQLPGMAAESLLAALRTNQGGTRILCGVHGGVLSEGVDYPGDLAVGVFIVGPALPSVSLEREVLRAHYDAPGHPLDTPEPSHDAGAGFDLAYVHPGIQRVVQAAGRVIRTQEDRAFILLLGERFSLPRYRDKLPPDWVEDLVDTDDPAPLVARFWREVGSGSAAEERRTDPTAGPGSGGWTSPRDRHRPAIRTASRASTRARRARSAPPRRES